MMDPEVTLKYIGSLKTNGNRDAFENYLISTQVNDSLLKLLRASPEPFYEDTNVKSTSVPEISFQIQGAKEIVRFQWQAAITLGRKDVSNKIFPSIDLSEHNGVDLGVSRRHASVNFHQVGFHLMDLGSSNGTWINEKKLQPRQMTPIYDGDILSLGKLKIFVVVKSKSIFIDEEAKV